MTILNDAEIAMYCRGHHKDGLGPLIPPMLTPFEDEKKRKGALSYGLGHFGYDIRIKHKVFRPFLLRSTAYIDPTKSVEAVQQYEFDLNGGYVLRPQDFVLAGTLEYFRMPKDIVGLVKDKSTLARLGIAVQNTVLEPGWEGFLTIEISNHGDVPILLTDEMPIAQVLFYRGNEPTVKYSGRYQGQARGTGAIDHAPD